MRPLLAALLLTGCAGIRPSLPVFGPGALVNVTCHEPGRTEDSCDRARTNASAHVAWAVAAPALGHVVAGRKGLIYGSLGWIGLVLAREAFFHAPLVPDPGYPSEVRTDLLTSLAPTLILLGADWLME